MIETILNELRGAASEEDVARVSDKHRAAVRALNADPAQKAQALHIINLKAYRIWQIRTGAT